MKAHTMKLALVAAAFLGLTGCVVVDHHEVDGSVDIGFSCEGRHCLTVGADYVWIGIYSGPTLVAEANIDTAMSDGAIFESLHEGSYTYDIHAYSAFNELIYAADGPLEIYGGETTTYSISLRYN